MDASSGPMAVVMALLNVDRTIEDGLEKRLRAVAGLSLPQYVVLLRLSTPELELAVREHFARHLTEDDLRCLHRALVKVQEGNSVLADLA